MDFVELFNDSYERAAGSGEQARAFYRTFYERFLATPEVAASFVNTDLERQQLMLRESILALVDFSVHRRESPELRQVAAAHSRSGRDIHPRLYDQWLRALFDSLAIHDPGFGPPVELAWRIILAPGIAYMRFYYDRPLP